MGLRMKIERGITFRQKVNEKSAKRAIVLRWQFHSEAQMTARIGVN